MSACSFSAQMKEELAATYPHSFCCRTAMLYALYRFRSSWQNDSQTPCSELLSRLSAKPKVAESVKEMLETGTAPSPTCPTCLSSFLKGAFLAVGRITDPARAYHLEFAPFSGEDVALLTEQLENAGLPPAYTTRRGKPILYYKNNEQIQDVLNCIGAQNQAFAVVNAIIRKDLRNSANRRSNCDAANLSRTAKAVSPQLRAIRFLEREGFLSELPDELRETAELRLASPESSLPELARMHPTSMTKSGVNHRLQKIVQFAAEKNGGKEFQ